MSFSQPAGVRAFAMTAATALATGATLAPGWVQAQTVNVSATAVAATELDGVEVVGSNGLESPKFTAPLIDTPRSVTVIPQAVIQQTGSTSLTDVLRTVPGITMAMGEGGQPFGDRPFIRGFESASGITIDGLRDSGSQSRELFALESVEVVKGSSGAYAGRGATGGTINLVSKSAKPSDFQQGDLTIGTAELARVTADVNMAINDNVAARISALWQTSDVAGRDGVTDDRWGVAPTISFGMMGPTKATLGFYHYESDGIMDYGHPYDMVTGAPAKVDRDNFYGLVDRDFRKSEANLGTAQVTHEFSERLRLRGIVRYGKTRNDYIATNPDDSQGNVANGLVFRNTKSRNASTESLIGQIDLSGNFTTGSLQHAFAFGVEAGKEETTVRTYTVGLTAPGGVTIPRGGCNLFGPGPASGYNCTDLYNPNPRDPWTGAITLGAPTETDVRTASVYAFDTIDITDRWMVNLGLRYDDFSTDTSTNLSNDDEFVTWQVGLVYKPSANASLYASVGTGVNPSGATAGDGSSNISTSNEDLAPEKLKNFELGAKWAPHRRVSLTTAVFRMEKDNAHVPAAAGTGAPQIAVGEVRVQGLELGVSGSLTERWTVFGGYTYLDSKILDDGPINTDEGNRFPNTPKHSFSLWSTYQVLPKLSIGGGAFYMSKVYGDTANTRYVPDYWRFDAVATYQLRDHVQVRLNVQNLTDKTYYDRAYTRHMATVAPGRSASLTFSATF